MREMKLQELKAKTPEAQLVILDIGTGDGRFVLDVARANPGYLCIGIDPVAENMQRHSRLAAGKPAKGGAPNALFLRGSIEQLPGPFVGIGHKVTVNYPWGSLLRIVAGAQVDELRRMRAVCRNDAKLLVVLNLSVFDDQDYARRVGLPTAEFLQSREFDEAYRAAGFLISERRVFHGDPPVRTLWGRHLVRGSGRSGFMIEATAVSPAPVRNYSGAASVSETTS